MSIIADALRGLSDEQIDQFLNDLVANSCKRFRQELVGEDEVLERALRTHQASMARFAWKTSQKWSKWDEDGPVLMPDNTRMYYRKGMTEIVIQEFAPQIRLMKFKGTLVSREDSAQILSSSVAEKVHSFSLALPYVVFIFKFMNGQFKDLYCAFSDRPLKKLDETPMKPYLSNIDSTLRVCLGPTLNFNNLQQGNIVQQASYILSHFWHTTYTDEWGFHFWTYRKHFAAVDERLKDLKSWEAASEENPLFVIDDVSWMKNTEANFGDIVVRLLETDHKNQNLLEELYVDLAGECLAGLKQTILDNLKVAEKQTVEKVTNIASNLLNLEVADE